MIPPEPSLDFLPYMCMLGNGRANAATDGSRTFIRFADGRVSATTNGATTSSTISTNEYVRDAARSKRERGRDVISVGK